MNQIETDQAAREASGAHPYGRYLEEFEVGAVYKHWPAKTVTEADDHLHATAGSRQQAAGSQKARSWVLHFSLAAACCLLSAACYAIHLDNPE